MELENNVNQNNTYSKEKNKFIPIHKEYLEDSDTYDISTKNKTDNSEKYNSLIEEPNKGYIKSIGFFPKKIYIEKPEFEEDTENKRTYSMEEHLVIKDFVPHLKPMEIHLVPSKLNLNKNGNGELAYSKDNTFANNNCISCPNSEEESDVYLSTTNTSDKINNIRKTRKNLKKMKSNNIPKVMTKNYIESNCKLFKEDFKIEYESDKDSLDLNDNFLLFEDNDFFNNNITSLDVENENKKENKEEEHVIRKKRINSCSILDVLKNKISFDDTI